MRFGLQNVVIEQIQAVFARHSDIKKAILYGSRAMGTQRLGSDIDLTLFGDSLNLETMNRIRCELDDLNLPYMFDISIHHNIENPQLLDHISRVGVIFYDQKKSSKLHDFQ